MKLRETKDGSWTLHRPELDVFYHSVYGAWGETRHVFGDMGLMPAFERQQEGALRVLEVGFGTGLNVLDVWLRASQAQRHVVLDSLEPHPLDWKDVEALDYAQQTGVPQPIWQAMHEDGAWSDEHLAFTRLHTGVFEADLEEAVYDVVFYDAFAPAAQPELWTPAAMDRMRLALKPGGQLVTYCAKGDVRRAMEEAGFHVDRIPGPPGKREMLRATKVHNPEGKLNVRVYMVLTSTNDQGQEEVLVSYERLPMGGVMKFPGGGLEWGKVQRPACAAKHWKNWASRWWWGTWCTSAAAPMSAHSTPTIRCWRFTTKRPSKEKWLLWTMGNLKTSSASGCP